MGDYVRDREIVVPGQLLSDNPQRAGAWTYVAGGKVYAAVVGVASVGQEKINIMAERGPYKPSEGDPVVGVVTDVKPNLLEINLGGHLLGTLRTRDREKRRRHVQRLPAVGDVIYTTVKYSGIKGMFLDEGEGLKKIERGLLIWVSPVKIPRIIGKRGSMLNALKRETGCQFYVGRNGLIAIAGPDSEREFIAASAIRMIERESHSQGLTERVIQHVRKLVLSGSEEDDSEKRD